MESAKSLQQAIGDRVRALRDAAGIRQEDLARAAVLVGLPWNRATIAAIENGRRRLELGEFLVFVMALQQANIRTPGPGIRPVEAVDLIPDVDELLSITNSRVSGSFLRSLLTGRYPKPPLPDRKPTAWRREYLDHAAGRADAERAWRRIWPERVFDFDVMRLAGDDARGEAEEKAAAKLDVDAVVIAIAARKLWGRSLTQERDRRVAETAKDASGSALQAARGHETRGLLDELEPLLKPFRAGKRTVR